MPTSTSIFQYTLANWGSVPATYTISPSCSASTHVLYAPTDSPWNPIWGEKCYDEDEHSRCWPQPSDPTVREMVEDDPAGPRRVQYFSPGAECPAGWKTVGVLAHPSDGPRTSSGIFTVDHYQEQNYREDFPYVYQLRDVFGALLDPGETALACCPSSMSVEDGQCYSTFSSRPISTGCATKYPGWSPDVITTTFLLNGTPTLSSLILQPETASDPPTVTTTSFDANETSDWVPVSKLGPIYLVHQPSDTATAGEDGTETNAASKVSAGQTIPWKQLQTVSGILAVSVLAGALLVLPW